MKVSHRATIEVTAETRMIDVIQSAHHSGVPQTAKLDINEEPRTAHPTDPGGRKTVILTWDTE